MTHSELFFTIEERMAGLNEYESDALMEIVSKVADKGDSLRQFYIEVITANEYPNLPEIKKIAEKYSVPKLYASHINKKFNSFLDNIRIVCKENENRILSNKKPGLDPTKWTKNKVPMFSSTEKLTITKAGGLQKICKGITTSGYSDHLEQLFKEAAVEVSKIKYAKLITSSNYNIEYKEM